MTERQKKIIRLFHQTHSLLSVCREDQSVMIEQHKQNTLLVDRIQESARRMATVLDSMPHMCDLIEAIDEVEEPGAASIEPDPPTEDEYDALTKARSETDPGPSEHADPNGADGISRPRTGEPEHVEPPVDD